MSKLLIAALLALCLIQGSYSACADGTVEPSSTIITALSLNGDEVDCVSCPLGCKKCDEDLGCTDMWDIIDGAEIDSADVIEAYCDTSLNYQSYNKDTEDCDRCISGCATCTFDFDYCTTCKTGWDYERGGRSCLRASLGLAATNFVLSVLLVVGAVGTCFKASKLE